MKKLLFILMSYSVIAYSGSYIFASDASGIDSITHPTGQHNNVNTPILNISVCIDPTSTITAPLIIPVKNIVTTWNQLEAVSPNLITGASNNVPTSSYDWESVALHEVGHCLGLGHVNLGSQVSGPFTNTDLTTSTKGPDGVFDFGAGVDGIYGSSDDVRDDDVNLHWFNIGVNNPFIASPPYDATSYSRQLTDLPAGHLYVANSDRDVGPGNTEGVMQQLTLNDEAQRDLSIDDVSTIKLGMSGTDMISGSADDYVINLTYGGIASGCDINIKHDASYSGFARCDVTGAWASNPNHWNITSANIRMDPSAVPWFFNNIEKIIVPDDTIFTNGFEN